MTCGIYEIANTVSKFRYIGQSKRIEERWVEHVRLLERGAHPHQKLQQAWSDDGAKRFRYGILEELPLASSNRIMHASERVWMHKNARRLYNEQGMQPERKAKKPEGPPAALWPYTPSVPFIPRRHHLGPPEGMGERRTLMYSGRRDHIRLAEIQAEKKVRSLKTFVLSSWAADAVIVTSTNQAFRWHGGAGPRTGGTWRRQAQTQVNLISVFGKFPRMNGGFASFSLITC